MKLDIVLKVLPEYGGSADSRADARKTLDDAEAALLQNLPPSMKGPSEASCSSDRDIQLVFRKKCSQLAPNATEQDTGSTRQCKLDDLKDCTSMCERGHAGSCGNLASMYRAGVGVPRDLARAFVLSSKACQGGDYEECALAGIALLDGEGVAKDADLGVRGLSFACSHSAALGCYRLAFAYEEGTGVARDLAKTRSFYEQACNGDYADGCINLGIMLAEGKGGPKDEVKAAELFTKACGLGEKRGCEAKRILAAPKTNPAHGTVESSWAEVEAVVDDLAAKRFIARYASQHANRPRAARDAQRMQQMLRGMLTQQFCPAKKAFVAAAGQAEFLKRSKAKCRDNPPTATGTNGPERLVSDCEAVFAEVCL